MQNQLANYEPQKKANKNQVPVCLASQHHHQENYHFQSQEGQAQYIVRHPTSYSESQVNNEYLGKTQLRINPKLLFNSKLGLQKKLF